MAFDWKLPSREEMLASRWLSPFARYLSSPLIWRFNRRGVARGAALGMFAGFAVPVAQTPFAALLAVGVRANLPVAAAATFITNPFTVPFIYYVAWLVGCEILRLEGDQVFQASIDAGWLERVIDWLLVLAGPTYLGLLVFAASSAFLSYMGVQFGWRIMVARRRQQRLMRRNSPSDAHPA